MWCLEALHATQGWHIIMSNCQKEEQGASLSCQMCISSAIGMCLFGSRGEGRRNGGGGGEGGEEGKLYNPELRRSLWLGVLQVVLAQKRPFPDCTYDQVLLWKCSLQWTSRTVTEECSETPKLSLKCSHDSPLSQAHRHVYYIWVLWKLKLA